MYIVYLVIGSHPRKEDFSKFIDFVKQLLNIIVFVVYCSVFICASDYGLETTYLDFFSPISQGSIPVLWPGCWPPLLLIF